MVILETMGLVKRLRHLAGANQAELAKRFDVSQPAISQYESGRRSPNLDRFVAVAEGLGRRLVLVPDRITQSNDRSERFSWLLYQRVAEHFVSDPGRVRRIGHRNLRMFSHTTWLPYVEEWQRLLDPRNETELLVVLCIPDVEMTGLLSSSPFAGVLSDHERTDLLDLSRSA